MMRKKNALQMINVKLYHIIEKQISVYFHKGTSNIKDNPNKDLYIKKK